MAGEVLRGRTVALLGGDRRELELARSLRGLGANVVAAGLGREAAAEGIALCREARAAVTGADAVVAPVSGTDGEGRILSTLDPDSVLRLDAETFQAFHPGAALLVGRAVERVRALAESRQVRVIETAELDTLAWLNAVPTAEGAIMLAFAESPTAVAWSRSVVLGFGRCAKTLGLKLAALGASVTVAARHPEQQAEARAMGFLAVPLDGLADAIKDADFIFNTIPAPVLDARQIRAIRNGDALIVDIASAPGGTDFEECRELGIKAILAPGLPGRVAPKTAGVILSEALVPVIARALTL